MQLFDQHETMHSAGDSTHLRLMTCGGGIVVRPAAAFNLRSDGN